MKLYMHPASTCSRTVMLFIAEEALPVEMQVVDIMTGEHHKEPFASLNPKRMIPVLDDDGFILSESAAILLHLARKSGSRALPTDPRALARVDELMHWLNSDFYRDWGYNLIYPQLFPHHVRPSEEAHKATLQWGLERSKNGLRHLDTVVLAHGGTYLLGDQMTVADYLAAGILSAGELIRVDLSAYPNLQRWYGTMESLPSWPKVTEALHGFVEYLRGKEFVTVG